MVRELVDKQVTGGWVKQGYLCMLPLDNRVHMLYTKMSWYISCWITTKEIKGGFCLTLLHCKIKGGFCLTLQCKIKGGFYDTAVK